MKKTTGKAFFKRVYNYHGVSPCYFRTTAIPPFKKAIIQITERCNLSCAHCFVSAKSIGDEMSFLNIKNVVLERLLNINVKKITVTGGEPLCHPDILEICRLFADKDMEITVCTNGTLLDNMLLKDFSKIQKLKFNISLDGFSFQSHGKFRGMKEESDFYDLLSKIEAIGESGKLNGLLCTPNIFCEDKEFVRICEFAKQNKARYVLFNPLSNMGRGQKSLNLTYKFSKFENIKNATQKFVDDKFEVIYIRFPNFQKQNLPKCHLGDMIYIFTNGDYTLCPYLVFACNNTDSPYKPKQFISGNIFEDEQISFDETLTFILKESINVNACQHTEECFGGCHAAKIMNGKKISDCDVELCPILNDSF